MDSLKDTKALEILDTDVQRKRVEYLFEIARQFCPEPIEDIFVSEYRDNDGRQIIESVWFFTHTFVSSFNYQTNLEEFDVTPLSNNLQYLDAKRIKFDFLTASDSSRFTLYIVFQGTLNGTLKAAGENCLDLLRIVRERLLPNFSASNAVIIGNHD